MSDQAGSADPGAVRVAAHPLLAAEIFATEFPLDLGEMLIPNAWGDMLRVGASVPLAREEQRRKAVRDLLRHGGYKPTGRGKPSSEYLLRAAGQGKLNSINLAVDACNITSLHSGLPISVVDLERAVPPLSIAIAPESSSYVFNPAGQAIDLAGLLCVHDEQGPCANAVKDSQRTKTHPGTRHTLSVIWGLVAEPEITRRATDWYRELLGAAGARTAPVAQIPLEG